MPNLPGAKFTRCWVYRMPNSLFSVPNSPSARFTRYRVDQHSNFKSIDAMNIVSLINNVHSHVLKLEWLKTANLLHWYLSCLLLLLQRKIECAGDHYWSFSHIINNFNKQNSPLACCIIQPLVQAHVTKPPT